VSAAPASSFDFDAAVVAPFRMQPGLRRLASGARQLTPNAPGSRHMREKLAVLSAFAPQALLRAPGFDATPALHALAAQAAAEHPAALQWDGAAAQALGVRVHEGGVEQHAAGRFGLGDEIVRCLRTLAPPWRLAGLLQLAFAEDFAIVDARDGRIPWLAVALPSHWAPEEKIGRRFAAVHAPVADGERLRQASAALVTLVTAGERWERFVWTVTTHPRLHAHPQRVDRNAGAAFDPWSCWFRSERQTFIPLPALRQAVFTILVDVVPLAAAVAPPGRAAKLHAAMASMSPAVLDYRGLTALRDPLLAWLARWDARDGPAGRLGPVGPAGPAIHAGAA
jgi:dimethylamine monooxygenase subunit A